MLRAFLEHRLRAAWQRRGALAWLLWPLSRLYGALAARQRGRYLSGARPVERLPVPVIVVGNVMAGGAGKTPTTLAVVAHLRARGWRPGIVSRGHGRRTGDCREVRPGSDAREVGDEPLLLRRRADVPVFVARQRAAAGRALLAAHPGTDVLVCDDGLQHLALARDVELVVFDARGSGNGWLLPAGPLREPWPRSIQSPRAPGPHPAELVLWTEAPPPGGSAAPHGFVATRRLAEHAVHADGDQVPLAELRGQPLTALAAIARPEAFFAMLRDAGLTLADTIALPDHYDFNSLPRSLDGRQSLICTEKDAVKLWSRRPDALAVPLRLAVPPAFFAALDERLAARGYHPATAP
ncbi:MAG TPA: tetraacyldisaccharide 4'-kinase [Ottowia sp.]|nr:tetraacyldisaccharide 4'-kinase [Ottowia sp.]